MVFPLAGLVKPKDTRVQVAALVMVLLPRSAVSVCSSTVKLVAVSNCTQTSMVQTLVGKGLPSVSWKLPSLLTKPSCW